MRRILTFSEDVVSFWKKGGLQGSFRFVRSRIFRRVNTLLYELQSDGREHPLPDGWQVTVVKSLADTSGVELLCNAGGDLETRHFKRKAMVFLVSIGDELVARTWCFPDHSLSRRLGGNAVYFGGMYVRPDWRGQGIQGKMTRYLASLQPAATRIIMEVEHANFASQRGLAKAGCVFQGRLCTVVFLGRIVSARIKHPAATTTLNS